MSVMNVVNSRLASLLRRWCCQYLDIDSDAEALVVQLNSRPLVLRNVSLNREAFNAELCKYGVELVEGHISQAEVSIVDWANLSASIEVDTLTLTLSLHSDNMNTAEVDTEKDEDDETPFGLYSANFWWKSLMSNIEAWFKKFLTNLKVIVKHVVMDFIQSAECCSFRIDLYNCCHATEIGEESCSPHVLSESVQLSTPSGPDEMHSMQKMLQIDNLDLKATAASDRSALHFMTRAENIAMDLTPSILKSLMDIMRFIKHVLDPKSVQREADAVVDAIFYEAEEFDRGSSVYSDATESMFFDCEELSDNTSVMATQMISFTFEAEIQRCTVLLHAESAAGNLYEFLFRLREFVCSGRYEEDISLDLSIQRICFSDQSPGVEPISTLNQHTAVPTAFQQILTANEIQCASFAQLGVSQLKEKPCVTMHLAKDMAHKHTVKIQTESLVFYITCEAIDRALCLTRCLVAGIDQRLPRTGDTNTTDLEVSWFMRQSDGLLEQPRSQDNQLQGYWLVEAVFAEEKAFAAFKRSIGNRQFSSLSAPLLFRSVSISLASISVHRCSIKNNHVDSCRCVFDCKSPTHRSSQQSNHLGMTVDITWTDAKRQSTSNLPSLAYALEHTYSQIDSTYQERTLSRIEYEGKCVRSADLLLEVTIESIRLDLEIDTIEASVESFLRFWTPTKIADQLRKSSTEQIVVILNTQEFTCQFRNETVQEVLHPWQLDLSEMEIFIVSGVQRDPISTLSLLINDIRIDGPERRICRMGSENDEDEAAIQFFHVSELDFRNAKFKQWASLQQPCIALHIDQSILDAKWILTTITGLLMKNKDRIQTDIEVETAFSVTSRDIRMGYSTSVADYGSEEEITLECHIDQLTTVLKNQKKLTAQICDLDMFITSGGLTKRWLGEKQLQILIRLNENEMDAEIKNENIQIELLPAVLTHILHLANSFKDLIPRAPRTAMAEAEQHMDDTVNLMEHIRDDAFRADDVCEITDKRTSLFSNLVTADDEENGFVLVDDLDSEQRLDHMKTSETQFIDGGQLAIQDDYIAVSDQSDFVEEDEIMMAPLSNYLPPAKWAIRCVDLQGLCTFSVSDKKEHVNLMAEGVNISCTSFQPGYHYKNRLSVAVQEFTVSDHRSGENGRRIAERNRCQLRTECNKRISQQQTLTSPMLQLSIETVVPDIRNPARLTEKRVHLRFVPLRLRLSKSLSDFSKTYTTAIPSSSVQYTGTGSYFQKCTVAPFFVVVDYRPRRIDMERLKNGQTSELVNVIQWEGLEFFLDEMNIIGVSGWENLLSIVTQNWTNDISHSKKYRLLGGLPALGALKRISPAAQDVVRATVAKVTRKEPAEQEVRGIRVAESVSLQRALGEFGRVCSLEVLNLCANGTECAQHVFDGADAEPVPSNVQDGLERAANTLKKAAHSVVTEPYQSAQSGEGAAVAMSKALWAMPRALLAPASAAATVIHGTLRSACDALDSEHVFES